ncbi:hypothetical protein RHSIM_Rhsim11G0163800 [Rhododendron simsii]|uniref:Uncharacterized protein n=1 Tax=Rhododendron simsii TaxID=118357 RepID=A0A834LA66_RHOSS|nr:hypothetical protein RHSIM_Rhsim11G0163800 [Rhododendron simsii]
MSAPPFTDTSVLQQPLVDILRRCSPDCVVTDTFHRWAADAVDGVGIPRVIFNGNCCFARCCEDSVKRDWPHKKVGSDSEPFALEGLPDRIELTRSQLPVFVRTRTEFPGKSMRAEQNSFGQVVNSFYELEPAYVEYYRNQMGKKAWLIGPRKIVVGRDKVEAAVKKLMGGSEEAEMMTRRAKELAERTTSVVEERGSSWNDVEALIGELKSCWKQK